MAERCRSSSVDPRWRCRRAGSSTTFAPADRSTDLHRACSVRRRVSATRGRSIDGRSSAESCETACANQKSSEFRDRSGRIDPPTRHELPPCAAASRPRAVDRSIAMICRLVRNGMRDPDSGDSHDRSCPVYQSSSSFLDPPRFGQGADDRSTARSADSCATTLVDSEPRFPRSIGPDRSTSSFAGAWRGFGRTMIERAYHPSTAHEVACAAPDGNRFDRNRTEAGASSAPAPAPVPVL